MTKIALIYGSSRPSKNSHHVTDWYLDKIDISDGITVDKINLKEVGLPFLAEPKSAMSGEYEMDSTIKWSETISSYDGYLFVVSEYNLGVTPLLKNAIDHLFDEWKDKPVAYISYGSYEKSTAVEHLRTIMSAFPARQVEETFHLNPFYQAIGEDGTIDESKRSGAEPEVVFEKLLELCRE